MESSSCGIVSKTINGVHCSKTKFGRDKETLLECKGKFHLICAHVGDQYSCGTAGAFPEEHLRKSIFEEVCQMVGEEVSRRME